LVTSASFTDLTSGKMYVYQWSPSEMRWLKVTANVPGINLSQGLGTSAFNGNRIYTLISAPWLNESYESKLVIIDLVDPLEAPLVPINMIRLNVDRIYAPFAQVVNS
jgi:hypothetical protein